MTSASSPNMAITSLTRRSAPNGFILPRSTRISPGQTLATRSREVIEQWAADRGGHPVTVPGTEHEGRPGLLRIAFTDDGDSRLQEIPWDAWFRSFDDRLLVFLYQENKTDGSPSTFFRLDSPEREDG